MKNNENLKKLKRIAELYKEIGKDNDLINQNLDRYVELVAQLRLLLQDEEFIKFANNIEDILVIIDENIGFTIEGAYKNPYMEAIVEPTNKVAKEYHQREDAIVIEVNEGHTKNSQEFKTLARNTGVELPHCIKGEREALYAEPLRWIEDIYPVFEKNTTMAAFAPGYLLFFLIFKNLKRVKFAGGITDMCYIEAVLPTQKFFDQNDLDIEVIADQNIADTYDAPWHNRDEWNGMAYKFMNQAGIKILEKVKK